MNSRLEYVRAMALDARRELDEAFAIGDTVAIPGRERWYNEVHAERNWLEAVDAALLFPHEWYDFSSTFGMHVDVRIDWPTFEVALPFPSPPVYIEHGGMRFQYDARTCTLVAPERVSDEMIRSFLNLNQELRAYVHAAQIARTLLADLNPPGEPHRVYTYDDDTWSQARVLAARWINDDADRYWRIGMAREMAGVGWGKVLDFAVWTLYQHQPDIDWNPFKPIESETS